MVAPEAGGGTAGEVCWEKSLGAPVTRAAMAAILPKKLRRVLISMMCVSSVDKPMLTNGRASTARLASRDFHFEARFPRCHRTNRLLRFALVQIAQGFLAELILPTTALGPGRVPHVRPNVRPSVHGLKT